MEKWYALSLIHILGIINNENIGEDKKQEAIASMVEMTDLAEQEEAAELLLEAKGFANVVVNLTLSLIHISQSAFC